MDFLKPILGEDLFNQVSAKVKDSGLKIADLSKGDYVSKDKYSRAVAEKDDLIRAKDTEIESLRKGLSGDEKLKKEVETLTEELNTAKSELGRFRNEKSALAAGFKGKYLNAVISEASKHVDKETTFDKALETVGKDYPEWKEDAKPQKQSSFPLGGGDAKANREKANDALRSIK